MGRVFETSTTWDLIGERGVLLEVEKEDSLHIYAAIPDYSQKHEPMAHHSLCCLNRAEVDKLRRFLDKHFPEVKENAPN